MSSTPDQSGMHGPVEVDVLRLSLELDGPVPDVVIAGVDGVVLLRARVDAPPPLLSASFVAVRIEAIDILEHVLDEEAWMAELAATLQPGGTLLVRVPGEGPLAWLDAMNIYRYLVDTLGRGNEPRQTRPIGWHRHYRPAELRQLFGGCGLAAGPHSRNGQLSPEVCSFITLLWKDLFCGDHTAERRMLAKDRNRGVILDRRSRLGALGTRLTITGTKP